MRALRRFNWTPLLLTFTVLLSAPSAQAFVIFLQENLAEETLSQTVPLVLFSPNAYTAADYTIEWVGAPIPDVKISLGERSLQWVRVLDVLLLPRGRLLMRAEHAEGGVLKGAAGFVQPLTPEEDGSVTGELPIALFSGDQYATEIVLKRGGKEMRGKVQVRFKPRPETQAQLRAGERVIFDSSCSPYRLSVDPATIEVPADTWAFVGCRLVYSKGDKKRTSSLELLVFWDGVGHAADVGGVRVEPTSASLFTLRLRSKPGTASLRSGPHVLNFKYSIPENLYIFGIGVGLGPYVHDYYYPGSETHAVTAMPTLYGSYFFDETMRVVGFAAGAVHKNYYADIGVYLLSEQTRALDERLSLNLLLGGHVLGFRGPSGHQWAFSAPQGAEVVYRDFLVPGYNATVGTFIYPPINDRSYYNLWLRYGTNRWFAELNYIGWQESVENGPVRARNVGVSVGLPFALKLL